MVVGRDGDVGQAARGVERRAQVLPAHDAGGHVATVAAHHVDVDAEVRQVWREPLEALAVEEQHLAAGVGDRVLELGPEPPRVQRDRDRAERHRRPEAHHPLRVVAHADGDAVALADAVLGASQAASPATIAEVLGVRRALAVVDEEVAIAERGGRREEVAHRRRGALEHAQRHAWRVDRLQFERLSRRGERGDGVGPCHGHVLDPLFRPRAGRPMRPRSGGGQCTASDTDVKFGLDGCRRRCVRSVPHHGPQGRERMGTDTTSMELIASGLQFPEGPIWLRDGRVLVVEITVGDAGRGVAGRHRRARRHDRRRPERRRGRTRRQGLRLQQRRLRVARR